jgi:hypothetical protein
MAKKQRVVSAEAASTLEAVSEGGRLARQRRRGRGRRRGGEGLRGAGKGGEGGGGGQGCGSKRHQREGCPRRPRRRCAGSPGGLGPRDPGATSLQRRAVCRRAGARKGAALPQAAQTARWAAHAAGRRQGVPTGRDGAAAGAASPGGERPGGVPAPAWAAGWMWGASAVVGAGGGLLRHQGAHAAVRGSLEGGGKGGQGGGPTAPPGRSLLQGVLGHREGGPRAGGSGGGPAPGPGRRVSVPAEQVRFLQPGRPAAAPWANKRAQRRGGRRAGRVAAVHVHHVKLCTVRAQPEHHGIAAALRADSRDSAYCILFAPDLLWLPASRWQSTSRWQGARWRTFEGAATLYPFIILPVVNASD